MRMDKWIVIVAIVMLAALTSCRKTPSNPKNTVRQQPNAARTEPQIAQQTNVARMEPERVQSEDERSCQEFVHKFYDWYVHGVWSDFCKGTHDTESCNKAAEFGSVEKMSMKQVLSPKLEKLFNDDQAAEAAANEDGVGYLEDGDRFLNTNGGPSSHYEVENVRVKNGVCNADVYGESDEGAKDAKIMPELAKTGNRWVITNIYDHYDFYDKRAKKQVSGDDDLVSGLTNDLKYNRDVIKHKKK
jgi:hypothetical protein